MSKFFTRTGDDGYAGLLGEGRVPKSDLRIETVGTIDEASAALAVARAGVLSGEGPVVIQVQRDLYGIMGEVAATAKNAERFRVIGSEQVAWIEEQIERISKGVESIGEFIVPGDTPSGAAFDMARTVVRRAERRMAELAFRGDIQNPELLKYLNRLSSLCYVLELVENKNAGPQKPTLAKG